MTKAGPSLGRATMIRAADTARKLDPQLGQQGPCLINPAGGVSNCANHEVDRCAGVAGDHLKGQAGLSEQTAKQLGPGRPHPRATALGPSPASNHLLTDQRTRGGLLVGLRRRSQHAGTLAAGEIVCGATVLEETEDARIGSRRISPGQKGGVMYTNMGKVARFAAEVAAFASGLTLFLLASLVMSQVITTLINLNSASLKTLGNWGIVLAAAFVAWLYGIFATKVEERPTWDRWIIVLLLGPMIWPALIYVTVLIWTKQHQAWF